MLNVGARPNIIQPMPHTAVAAVITTRIFILSNIIPAGTCKIIKV